MTVKKALLMPLYICIKFKISFFNFTQRLILGLTSVYLLKLEILGLLKKKAIKF